MATEHRSTRPGLTVVPSRQPKLPSLAPHLAAEYAVSALGVVDWIWAEPRTWRADVLREHRNPAQAVAEDHRRMPDVDAMRAVIRAVDAALSHPGDPRVIDVAVALLFDSRAREPANPEVYVRTLAFDLVDMGFLPAVVAAACQRLRRGMVFVPEIAEVIAECTKVRGQYAATRRMCQRALAAYEANLQALAQVEADIAAGRLTAPPPRAGEGFTAEDGW